MMPFLVVVLYFIFSFQVKYDLEIFLIRYLNQTMNDTTKQLNDFFFFFYCHKQQYTNINTESS